MSDQLTLIFIINLFDELGVNLSTLKIFQYEKIPGKKHETQALGLLNPEQFKAHPEPYIPNKEHITIAKSAWNSVTADNPEEYLQFIHTNHESMPLLGRALKYLLFRYPKSSNGLSFWDEKLLQYTEEHGPTAARIIGHTLGDCMDGLDLVGDFYMFSRLKKMGK